MRKKPARLGKFLFNFRLPWLIIFALATVFLGYSAAQVRPDASFTKMIPTQHPFIQNYFDYQRDLSSLGNVVRVAVEHTEGDIFDAEFQETVKNITDEVFFIPGVNRSGLRSLWTPNVRWMEVTEEGFVGGPVIPDGYDGSDESIAQLVENVLRSGEVGNPVANNFESTIIYVPLDEVNPDTGEKLDYADFSQSSKP